MHVQPEGIGLGSERLKLRGGHLTQAVFLTVEQVQAQALQFVAIGEVQQVARCDTAVGQVGQQGVGMGKQAQLRQSVEQLAGQCLGQ
ncbi:hypothetical protein D3C87_1016320 [compost metagenome]